MDVDAARVVVSAARGQVISRLNLDVVGFDGEEGLRLTGVADAQQSPDSLSDAVRGNSAAQI